MRRFFVTIVFLMCAIFASTSAFAQTPLRGIVQDSSKAVLPGVTVTVQNTETGVTQTSVSNEEGVYNVIVTPGIYKISASLRGFKKAEIDKLQIRLELQNQDITLEVGAENTTVNVIADANVALRESSPSIGEVLPEYRIRELPIVGNNVLDLVKILPGYRQSTVAGGDTIAGLDTSFFNTTVNGMTVTDGHWANISSDGVYSVTRINPDMVSEIRLILAPVDAEYGHGNSQVQVTTRSGTNQYSGTIRFTPRNNGMDANSWANNNATSVDPADGKLKWRPTKPNWNNTQAYTISYGGPIIKNKTFFFGLFEQTRNKTRQLNATNGVSVLSDPAREGIFRYFDGWIPGNATASTSLAATTNPAGTSIWPAVGFGGNLIVPIGTFQDPQGTTTPYSSAPGNGLKCFQVFGNPKPSGAPYTNADCLFDGIQGTFINNPFTLPNAAAGIWDARRAGYDSTGYIQNMIALMPHANYFAGAGDGLNAQRFRFLRGSTGSQAFGLTGVSQGGSGTGTNPDINTWQTNIKIDHNISAKHRVSGQWSYQPSSQPYAIPDWPNGVSGFVWRHPQTLTLNMTSTLSPTLVNDARAGARYTNTRFENPWAVSDQAQMDYIKTAMPATSITPNGGFLIDGKVNPVNGKTYPILFTASGGGNYDFSRGFAYTGAPIEVIGDTSPTFTFNDSISWTKDKHSFKFSGELRLTGTSGFGESADTVAFSGATWPKAQGGTAVNGGTQLSASPFSSTTGIFDTLQQANAVNTFGNINNTANGATHFLAANGTSAAQMASFLYGGVASIRQDYWTTSAANFVNNTWEDITTAGEYIRRRQTGREWAFFAKDDWRIRRDLTLNFGVRWEYYEPIYLTEGLTTDVRDHGYGLFGAARSGFAGTNPFDRWGVPGNLYLANYGPPAGTAGQPTATATTANALTCVPGVAIPNTSLVSTCDPTQILRIDYIGEGITRLAGESDADFERRLSASQTPRNNRDFAPSVGFSWQLPWFGKGKTTIRGGFGMTFGGTGIRLLNTQIGSTLAENMTGASLPISSLVTPTHALSLADLPNLVPVLPDPNLINNAGGHTRNPSTPTPPIYEGTASLTSFAPEYKTPYAENVTLALTRNLSRTVTLNLNYAATLGHNQAGNFNVNTRNWLYNQELFDALEAVRRGENPRVFDEMLAGIQLRTGTASNGIPWGPIGTTSGGVVQHAGSQMRNYNVAGVNLGGQIANGDYNAATDSLTTLVPTGLLASPITTAHNNRLIRNGCARLAGGGALTTTAGFVNPPVGTLFTNDSTGAVTTIPLRCFPENYFVANTQIDNPTYNANLGGSAYHSLQTQVTIRPNRSGMSFTSTYTWSKTMSTPGTGFRDIRDNRRAERAQSVSSSDQDFRSNGTFSIPMGPNQLFFGNSSGMLARAVEGWKMSIIYQTQGGSPRNISGVTNMYAANQPDVVSSLWTNPRGRLKWDGPRGANRGPAEGPDGILGTKDDGHDSASWFGIGRQNPFFSVPDPQCNLPAAFDEMSNPANPSTRITAACTLTATAIEVPAGTPGSFVLGGTGANAGRTGIIVLQSPQPGKMGTLGKYTMLFFGRWSLDANISKDFKVRESTRLQFRIDATNVLNHPLIAEPTLSQGNFGATIVSGFAPAKSGSRAIAGNISINFQKYPFQ